MKNTKAQPRPLEFNLAVLEKFNPALIYGFDPESSILGENLSPRGYLAHSAGQWENMFAAYYYAEYTLLPILADQGIKNLTAEQLLEWLNQLHLRIAATLAKDVGVPAGQFNQHYGSRWHQGSIVEDIIYIYLSKSDDYLKKSLDSLFAQMSPESFASLQGKITKQDNFQSFCLKLLVACGVNEKDGEDFLKLLDDVVDDQSINVPGSMQRMRPGLSNKKADAAMAKFRFWYSDCNPSNAQKAIIKKIVGMFLSPEKIPQIMTEFAKNLLAQWQSCDPNNLDELAKLLCYAFDKLANEIHPYFNANGRVTTCLLNVILASFGKQTILLRNPQERDDPNSSYSVAIRQLNVGDQSFLIDHLKQRMQEAEKGKTYSNEALSKIIVLRVKVSRKITDIALNFPEQQVDEFYESCLQSIEQNALDPTTDNMDSSIIARLEFLLKEFDTYEKNCNAAKNAEQKKQGGPTHLKGGFFQAQPKLSFGGVYKKSSKPTEEEMKEISALQKIAVFKS